MISWQQSLGAQVRIQRQKEDRLWSQQLLVLAGTNLCIKAKLGKHPSDSLSKLQLDSATALLFKLSSFVSALLLVVFQMDYLLQEFCFSFPRQLELISRAFPGQYFIPVPDNGSPVNTLSNEHLWAPLALLGTGGGGWGGGWMLGNKFKPQLSSVCFFLPFLISPDIMLKVIT